jgi:hypothetical protein
VSLSIQELRTPLFRSACFNNLRADRYLADYAGMTITSFRDLDAWKLSMDLAESV